MKAPRNVIKIVLCGEGGVGKTSLATMFTRGVFEEKQRITIGIQHFFKHLEYNGIRVSLNIWDLGGEERFRFLAPIFLRGARGALFVFDVTREETLLKIDDWLRIFLRTIGDIPRVLVGNKIDLEEWRLVPRDLAEKFAKEKGFVKYIETSARLGLNVNEAFEALLEQILEEMMVRG